MYIFGIFQMESMKIEGQHTEISIDVCEPVAGCLYVLDVSLNNQRSWLLIPF